MTHEQFKLDKESRDKLRKVLESPIFRAAIGIIVQRRRAIDYAYEVKNLSGDSMQSLRLYNQRIGLDSLIVDLYDLCEPPLPAPQEPEATYDERNAHDAHNTLNEAELP